MSEYIKYFPHKNIRQTQSDAIEFAIDEILNNNKRFVIIEAGTGVGKSAIGYTLSRYLNDKLPDVDRYEKGSYFITTQKVLQDQYIKDFGKHGMRSIKSSSNYMCHFHKSNTCAQSQQLLRAEEKGSRFFNACAFNCVYKKIKRSFVDGDSGVTNFPYFLTETNYSGKITPRKVLIIDEAHNAEEELSKFIEITVTERFSKSMLKIGMPQINTQTQAIKWIEETYYPKLKSYKEHMESMLDKYEGIKEKLKDFRNLAQKFDLLQSHESKIKKFLMIYDKDNWVFDQKDAEGRKGKRWEFKPIDVAVYAESMLFRLGQKVIMMSATILNKDGFCELLGINRDDAAFISMPSPFPVKNRPIFSFPIGKMSAKEIDQTLPKMVEAVSQILHQHKDEKGIIHCHTFKIANYLKRTLKDKRILVHDSTNREAVLQKHIKSKKPTVLLSPSMTEGVDLVGDVSRFQVICKIPFPYLGDKLIRKKMNKWKWWYPMKTAKTIMQASGRSIRSDTDYAVTYILDANWEYFRRTNGQFFPQDFMNCLRR